MNPTRPLVIHELLPNEMMGVIFEEHAKLEWRAPAIDGRVCRIWRQIVLNTPRAWAYPEISDVKISFEEPARKVREWLRLSGSAPLYIRVIDFLFDENLDEQPLCNLLSGYHTRIVSLRLPMGDRSLFDRRDFPCLQHLDIDQWHSGGSPSCSVRWASMPELRSLRLAAYKFLLELRWSELTQLEALSLYCIRLTSPPQVHQSLTTLVLDCVSVVKGAISSPITFPSLTYLSLSSVTGFKPYINAPCLVIFHEGMGSQESFSSPVPSLVEYRVLCLFFDDANPARWHCSFPNLLRLTIVARPHRLVPFFLSLSRDPHSLPALQTIHARHTNRPLTEQQQAVIKDLVRVRGEACQMDVVLHFDTKRPYQNPIFFGEVSRCLSNDL
jgi:hypothetical protein